ncbi:MAG: hypothetical protein GWO24_24615, partial [Akkermansiaceae bacterium]|nr:hypothetical protein [Akkermansiaceae bacterium]
MHHPPVPKRADKVTITARVELAGGSPTVQVFSRLDSASADRAWESQDMFDDGVTDGDAVANDGIYTAELPARSDNSIVQFYVKASAPGGGSTIIPRHADDNWSLFHQIAGVDGDHLKPAMYVVDEGARRLSARDLRHQRFVVAARHLQMLTQPGGESDQNSRFKYAFPRMSNQFFPCTFIGNEKDIIYNCETRKAGSPWQRVTGHGLDGGGKTAKWKTPGDQRYRGWSRRATDQDPVAGRLYH